MTKKIKKKTKKKTRKTQKTVSKKVPFEFVLEELSGLDFYTKPMFGCLAIYVAEKIVLILRDKEDELQDNGVWLATDREYHSSLKLEFPNMRSIQVLANGNETNWQILPADAADFEPSVIHACQLVLKKDPRIGRIPARKKKSRESTKKSR